MRELLKLRPVFKDYIWGGEKMRGLFGFVPERLPLAEAWVLSCHKNGECAVSGGEYDNLPLSRALSLLGGGALGSRVGGGELPLLIKLIDAAAPLSVQVHPADGFPGLLPGEHGKTECWYILKAEPGAFIYLGFSREVTREEITRRAADGSITEVLRKVPVSAGDFIFIPAGTVHAIGGGILLAEVQQNSDTTYRLYDYGRLDAGGNPRPLHLERAAAAATLHPVEGLVTRVPDAGELVSCEYFSCRAAYSGSTFTVNDDSFAAYVCLEGACTLDGLPFSAGDCALATAGYGELPTGPGARILVCRV